MIDEHQLMTLSDIYVYLRGQRYFREGRVKGLRETSSFSHRYRATVRGSYDYLTVVQLNDSDDSLESFECDCPVGYHDSRPCKHVIALLCALNEMLANSNVKLVDSGFFELFNYQDEEVVEPLKLEEQLFFSRQYGTSVAEAEFTVGRGRQYVVKDVETLLSAASRNVEFVFGKGLTIKPGEYVFAEGKSRFFWELMKEIYGETKSLRVGYMGYAYQTIGGLFFEKKRIHFSPEQFQRVLGYYEENGETIHLNVNGSGNSPFEIVKGNPPLEINIKAEKGGAMIKLSPSRLLPLMSDFSYVICGWQIYHTEAEWRKDALPVVQAFSQGDCLKMSDKYMGELFSRAVPQLKRVAQVGIDEKLRQKYKMVPLMAEVYVDYYNDGAACKALYHYGEQEFNPCLKEKPTAGLVRDSLREWQIEKFFERFGFSAHGGRYIQEDEERAYEFFNEGLPVLSKLADVFFSEAFKEKPVRQVPEVKLGVSVNQSNLLEMRFTTNDFDFDELVALLGAYRKKSRYYRLKDGGFVTLGEQQLEGLADFVESEGLRRGADGTMTMPLANALYLDKLAKDDGVLELEPSREYRRLVRSVANPEMLNLPIPAEVDGVLRDYQVTGFNWLSTLAAYGLGGILADDMGLGKTVQVIAFLLAHPADKPALVVSPTSLMYNWLEEIAKFAPSLKARAIKGTKKEREDALEKANDCDVIITTYNLLQRDIAMYKAKSFSWCFIDEAQYIKNPTTKNAKAVKQLQTGGYFALTGTPIENTLTELWSIFDFLMPNYLGTHKKFKTKYEIPIVRAQDEHAAKELSRHIAPFVLRRLKKDVLTELPDKVETKLIAEMEEEQLKVYMAYFAQAQKDFAEELKAHGFESSRIKILAILTRLRQIACDPSLFLENYEGGSAKLELLMEVVDQARLSGHRLLIFSQFTTMLHHIAARLEEAETEYSYLDGKTPPAERLALVNGFNAGSVPVFLISLKAGGTGLNLTGADMVIHYDPWWNPAVEDQATDRAYRIGQTKNVQVIKLLTKDTIEEKIYELQQSKKALIDKMIQPGESFITKLSEEEIRGLFA